MNSLEELNYFNDTTQLEYIDDRSAEIIFDRISPVNQYKNIISGVDHVIPLGIDVTDIVQGESLNIKFSITTPWNVDWGTLPSGVYATQNGNEHILNGITTLAQWEQVKDAIIDSSPYAIGEYYYTAMIRYQTVNSKQWIIYLTIDVGMTWNTHATYSVTSAIGKPSAFYEYIPFDFTVNSMKIAGPEFHGIFDVMAEFMIARVKYGTSIMSISNIIDVVSIKAKVTSAIYASTYTRSFKGNYTTNGKFNGNSAYTRSFKGNYTVNGYYNRNSTFTQYSNGGYLKQSGLAAITSNTINNTPYPSLQTVSSTGMVFHYNTPDYLPGPALINASWPGYEDSILTYKVILSNVSGSIRSGDLLTPLTQASYYRQPDTVDSYKEVGNKLGEYVTVSDDGTKLIYGLPDHSGTGGTGTGGAVHYLKLVSGTWQFSQNIMWPTTDASINNMGKKVILSRDGSTLIICTVTNYNSKQEARIYYYDSATDQYIRTNFYESISGSISNEPACAVSSNGNVVIIGDKSGNGTVYVYKRASSTTWTKSQTLTGSGAYEFGASLTIRGDAVVIIVGEPSYPGVNGKGRIIYYSNSGGNYASYHTEECPESSTNAYYGSKVTMSEDGGTIVVNYTNSSSIKKLAIYYSSTLFQQVIGPYNSSTSSTFGYSVSLSNNGDVLTVGYYDASVPKDRVETFRREYNGSNHNRIGFIDCPVAGTSTKFGYSTAMTYNGNKIFIGSYGLNSNDGAVFEYNYYYIKYSHTPGSYEYTLTLTGKDYEINNALINVVKLDGNSTTENINLEYRYYHPTQGTRYVYDIQTLTYVYP